MRGFHLVNSKGQGGRTFFFSIEIKMANPTTGTMGNIFDDTFPTIQNMLLMTDRKIYFCHDTSKYSFG